MRDQIGFDPARLLQDLRQTVEELVIRKRLELVCARHASSITRTFFPAWQPLNATISERDDFEGSLHFLEGVIRFSALQRGF